MIDTPVTIVSVNMRRRNPLFIAFLQATHADIVMVQEPWFGRLVPSRSDTNPDGDEVRGFAAHPGWEIFAPKHQKGDICKVVTYVRQTLMMSRDVRVVSLIDHHIASPSSQALEVSISGNVFILVNIYHHVVDRRPSLTHILHSPLDSILPTYVVGDFNTHSSTWSFPGATVSSWASPLEDWFEDSDLTLVNPTGSATRRGEARQRDSIIDLALLNDSALCTGRFSSLSVSFPDSLGSDHAALLIDWSPPYTPLPYVPTLLPGFVIDDSLVASWTKDFASLPTPVISDLESLSRAADALDTDIYSVSGKLFKRRHTPDFRGLRWWNLHCEAALTAVTSIRGESRKSAIKALRQTITEAKRGWSNDNLTTVTSDTLWKATAWRHGRRANKIPPLLKPDGSLTSSHTDIRQVLSARFFPMVPKPVPDSDPDDPAPLPQRGFDCISEEEVARNLATSSNKSAPGPTGITYKLLKWCHLASPSRLTTLFNAAISLGHHPWRSATVVPIPKPGKIDYRVAKAYRPISLLECCGKLLEKIVAKRILLDSARFNLLPARQFGSRDYHTATDAVLSMTHTVQTCVKSGNAAGLLLFDIQGFFDNLHVGRLVHVFSLLGFSDSLCSWVRSFLTDRRITLSFNGEPLPEVVLNHGTPQGSPMSPILSAIYILPLLRVAERWRFRSLSTYVDDGAIVATGATHQSVIQKCQDGFFTVVDWLMRNGLRIDPDKTEFIAFQRRRPNPERVGALRPSLDLRIPGGGTLTVRRSTTVRYLGVFVDEKLRWEPHVKIMAARARSALRGLHLLGNSVRGLDFHSWRTVFHAITLPVLLYGLPVWSHNAPKSLVNILQVAQNAAVRCISGTFRTNPVEPLHHMLAIPPIKYTIAKYRTAFSARLSRLPPTALLRNITALDQAAIYTPPSPVPTALSSLMPSLFPAFCIPTNLTWTHPRVHNTLISPKTPPRTVSIIELANDPPIHHTSIHIYPIPHPDHFVMAFLTFFDGTCIERGFRASHDRTLAATEAAIAGVLSLGPHAGHHTLIFLPNSNLHRPLLSLTKHKYLPQATLFTGAVAMHCFLHPDISVVLLPLAVKLNRKPSCADPRIFAANWPGPRGKDFNLAELRVQAQSLQLPAHTPSPPLKSLPFRLWKADQENCADPPRCKWTTNIIPVPESSTPSDLVIGALTLGQRRAMSAALQAFFQHCFCGAYSQRMRPTAGDVTTCPCTYSHTPIPMTELDRDGDPLSKAGGDRDQSRGRSRVAQPYATPLQRVSAAPRGEGFEALLAEMHDNPRRTPSHSPPPLSPLQRLQRRRRRGLRRQGCGEVQTSPLAPVLHSAPHILFDCPLVSEFRSRILKDSTVRYLFWSVKGAASLALFLLRSNSLLRPLPARPDPP